MPVGDYAFMVLSDCVLYWRMVPLIIERKTIRDLMASFESCKSDWGIMFICCHVRKYIMGRDMQRSARQRMYYIDRFLMQMEGLKQSAMHIVILIEGSDVARTQASRFYGAVNYIQRLPGVYVYRTKSWNGTLKYIAQLTK